MSNVPLIITGSIPFENDLGTSIVSTASMKMDSVNNSAESTDFESFEVVSVKSPPSRKPLTPHLTQSLKPAGNGVGVTIMMKPMNNSNNSLANTTTAMNKIHSQTSQSNLRKSQDKLFSIGNTLADVGPEEKLEFWV